MKIKTEFRWNSSENDLIDEFYRPVLSQAVLYQRKSGYFSSTSFVDVFKEIIDLINRNGRIQLITSPNISAEDKQIFLDSVNDPSEILSKQFFDDLKKDPDNSKHYFAQIMGYMMNNVIDGKPQLEIKIALTNDGEGIFHDKTGVIHLKNKEKIGFTGSNNETYSGWKNNHESFVAFYSWKNEYEKKQVEEIQEEFDLIWNEEKNYLKLYSIPNAVREKLLQISPKSQIEFQSVFKKACESKKIKIPEIKKTENNEDEDELRDYQKTAIVKWKENNFQGIFSMATGTGKTFTAFGCINELQKSQNRLVTIITCPMTHLVEQWKSQLKKYNKIVKQEYQVISEQNIVIYGETKWRRDLDDLITDFNRKLTYSGEYLVNNIIIFVTHQTANSNEFIEKIKSFKDTKLFLIADEVHNIGTENKQKSLLEDYECRLGLSATPKRHYDDEGTTRLFDYFGDEVFSYSLQKAINDKWLCEYEYWPTYAELTNEEMSKYNELTRKIAAKMGHKQSSTQNDDENRNDPANQRADVIANADNKLKILQQICEKKEWNFKQALIYCTSNPDPVHLGDITQLEKVNELLTKQHITVRSITYKNPTKDRLEILNGLAIGHYNIITAVKCLDEGTDVPSAELAIMMASSGNPKQYIQRRGRVLRQSEDTGKKKAVIYDIIVKPPMESTFDLRDKKLLAKELLRHKEFASSAKNGPDATKIVKDVANEYGIDIEHLTDESIREMK
ncbi:MAG: DEAD/DEAH box helicase family protein [Nitrosopumilus sp.]|nr:DEAD/DEAH box helicase family protein [Nitrosopumilus sp.]